jgi:phosphatidylserine/phosphatidylglycerophosphate/cardiolipin synthase-like enzyme
VRNYEKNGPLSVRAIAGSRSVLLGMSLEERRHAVGLRGFAIQCINETSQREYWLLNLRRFAIYDTEGGRGRSLEEHAEDVIWDKHDLDYADPLAEGGVAGPRSIPRLRNPRSGRTFRSLENPFQKFFWCDYATLPGHKYRYRVFAMYGAPGALEARYSVEIRVRTETDMPERSDGRPTHAIFFNRGVIASQQYAMKYYNQKPKDVPNRAAYVWLSRGLEEGLRAFIDQAVDERFGLYGAFYQFSYVPILEQFKAARRRGAHVHLLYAYKERQKGEKAGEPYPPGGVNWDAIQEAGISAITQPRSHFSRIAHNKFLVLTENEAPVAVWTGSTNITEGGIYGHSNVGHWIRDRGVAGKYLAFWKELNKDLEADELRDWNEEKTPLPEDGLRSGIHCVWSPRTRKAFEDLKAYATLIDEAEEMVCFTAAFTIEDEHIGKVLKKKNKDYLRYILMDKYPGGKKLRKQRALVELIERVNNNRLTVGASLEGAFGDWLVEEADLDAISPNGHVKFIHDKFLLVDPLGKDPVVVTGSANFSQPASDSNDENMLIIKGDTNVADVYLVEFMRLFTHYRFRAWAQGLGKKARKQLQRLQHLDTDDRWALEYYDEPARIKEREQFGSDK